jgi:hypothetical protein
VAERARVVAPVLVPVLVQLEARVPVLAPVAERALARLAVPVAAEIPRPLQLVRAQRAARERLIPARR